MGDVFDQITSGQSGQPSAPQSSQSNGDVFAVAAQSSQTCNSGPSSPQQPTGISRLWTSEQVDPNAPPVNNIQQLKDAAVGAGKTIVKGLGNIGDVATLGLTHLIPGSEKASAGIGALERH